MKAWYDSYCFAEEKVGVESLYNCDMALYYLSDLVATGRPPKKLIDANIRSDWSKLKTILAAQRHAETFEGVLPLTEELAEKYRDDGSPRDGLDGEARINGYLRAYFTMRSVYVVAPEFSHPCGFSDYVLFPNRLQDVHSIPQQSYVIELKYAPKDATDAQLAANHQLTLDQLKKYSEDPNLPALAGGTPVHYICYEFKGRDLHRLEEVDPATGAKIA